MTKKQQIIDLGLPSLNEIQQLFIKHHFNLINFRKYIQIIVQFNLN